MIRRNATPPWWLRRRLPCSELRGVDATPVGGRRRASRDRSGGAGGSRSATLATSYVRPSRIWGNPAKECAGAFRLSLRRWWPVFARPRRQTPTRTENSDRSCLVATLRPACAATRLSHFLYDFSLHSPAARLIFLDVFRRVLVYESGTQAKMYAHTLQVAQRVPATATQRAEERAGCDDARALGFDREVKHRTPRSVCRVIGTAAVQHPRVEEQ